jgi:hypothetical protein
LLHDDAYMVGLDGNFDTSLSLSNWVRMAESAARLFVSNCAASDSVQYTLLDSEKLPVIGRVKEDITNFVVVVHPLWSHSGGADGNILDEVIVGLENRISSHEATVVDYFDLKHRPTVVRNNIEKYFNQ